MCRGRHERIQFIGFCFCRVQKQTKAISSDRLGITFGKIMTQGATKAVFGMLGMF